MSRKSSKPKILQAARQLLEEGGGAPITIKQLAERAGLSRQAIYLHFDDLTHLLLDLSREVDTGTRTAELQASIDQAATAREALRNAVRVQAYIKPRLHALITALDVLRRSDPAAQAAYAERDEARYRRVVDVVQRLEAEGQLAPEWDVERAAKLAWAMMSQRVWEDLGRPRAKEYTRQLTDFLERAMCRIN